MMNLQTSVGIGQASMIEAGIQMSQPKYMIGIEGDEGITRPLSLLLR